MKVACEKCNKIIFFDKHVERYRVIDIEGDKRIVLCEECYEKLKSWLRNETTNKWIPCSTGLPKDDTSALITTIRGGEPRIGIWDERTKSWSTNYGHIRLEEVRAWMPLPVPYEEEA